MTTVWPQRTKPHLIRPKRRLCAFAWAHCWIIDQGESLRWLRSPFVTGRFFFFLLGLRRHISGQLQCLWVWASEHWNQMESDPLASRTVLNTVGHCQKTTLGTPARMEWQLIQTAFAFWNIYLYIYSLYSFPFWFFLTAAKFYKSWQSHTKLRPDSQLTGKSWGSLRATKVSDLTNEAQTSFTFLLPHFFFLFF